MSKRLPKTIISFEHNYYLDEDVFKMVNELEEKNIDLEEYNTKLMLCNSRFNAILTELEEWLKKEWNITSESPKGSFYEGYDTCMLEMKKDIQNKIQELKEKYK